MNDLAAIQESAAEASNRPKIINLSFFTQTSSSPGDSYEKLSAPMIETTERKRCGGVDRGGERDRPYRRCSERSAEAATTASSCVTGGRTDSDRTGSTSEQLPGLLLPEATGLLQESADDIRSAETAALDAILAFMGIGRLATIPSHHSPSVRFWMGLCDAPFWIPIGWSVW